MTDWWVGVKRGSTESRDSCSPESGAGSPGWVKLATQAHRSQLRPRVRIRRPSHGHDGRCGGMWRPGGGDGVTLEQDGGRREDVLVPELDVQWSLAVVVTLYATEQGPGRRRVQVSAFVGLEMQEIRLLTLSTPQAKGKGRGKANNCRSTPVTPQHQDVPAEKSVPTLPIMFNYRLLLLLLLLLLLFKQRCFF